MIFVENEGNTNPHINIALEEYMLRNFSPDNDYLLFYINRPSIIIGSYQNTLEEINYDYVRRKTFAWFAVCREVEQFITIWVI